MSKVGPMNSVTLDLADWRKLQFWRNAFIYFWLFSFLGHIVEIFWALLGTVVYLGGTPNPASMPLIIFAAPYGIGVIALRLTLYSYLQKHKQNWLITYIIGLLIVSLTEFLSAALIVLFNGSNPFWNYSNMPFNLFGFICLQNSLAFAAGAFLTVKWLIPLVDNVLQKTSDKILNLTFWIMLIIYIYVQFITQL